MAEPLVFQGLGSLQRCGPSVDENPIARVVLAGRAVLALKAIPNRHILVELTASPAIRRPTLADHSENATARRQNLASVTLHLRRR
jgi:hypothetical protein